MSERGHEVEHPGAGRLLLRRHEAAEALGMSLNHFKRHVQPQVPCVHVGALRLYRPADLEDWIARTVEGRRRLDR